jgi:acyl-CoA thioesterase-2
MAGRSAGRSAAQRLEQLVRHVDVQRASPASAATAEFVYGSSAGVFLGRSADLGWGRVYGGQTMAQGLAAAQRYAGPDRSVHQFGCHFLTGGDPNLPIRFETEALSSGRSFSVVHARALQGESTPLLAMTASFQTPEFGLEHQHGGLRPEWRTPDECTSLTEYMAPHTAKVKPTMRPLFDESTPLEVRPTEFIPPWDSSVREPTRAYWIRAKGRLPDDPRVHERLLTYISDWGLLEASMFPHPLCSWRHELQVSSLSHSMHFHRPFRLDEQWLCHAITSPTASGARGYSLGEFWSEQGALVASTAQEGLIRLRADRPKGLPFADVPPEQKSSNNK